VAITPMVTVMASVRVGTKGTITRAVRVGGRQHLSITRPTITACANPGVIATVVGIARASRYATILVMATVTDTMTMATTWTHGAMGTMDSMTLGILGTPMALTMDSIMAMDMAMVTHTATPTDGIMVGVMVGVMATTTMVTTTAHTIATRGTLTTEAGLLQAHLAEELAIPIRVAMAFVAKTWAKAAEEIPLSSVPAAAVNLNHVPMCSAAAMVHRAPAHLEAHY